MHKPYRDIVREGDMTHTGGRTRERKKRSWPKIPRSTIVNFVAIALLFAVIFALQQVSRNWVSSEPETVAAKVEAATVTLDDTVSAQATTDKPTLVTEEVETKAAIVTLKDDAEADETKAEEPQEKKPVVKPKKRKHRAARSRRTRDDPYWRDRQASVEELDNHYARERYKTLNHELASGGVQDTGYEPAPTTASDYRASSYDQPAIEETTYRPTSYRSTQGSSFTNDLDGESERQRYRAENRRLSGPDADLDY